MSFSRLLVGSSVLLAVMLYVWKGEPGRGDTPFAKRAEEIAQKDPNDLSAGEMLTRLQQIAQARPTEPQPQYHIGVLLKAQGRPDEALRAFQAALRRDDRHVPSLVAMGDLLVMQASGDVGAVSEQLYLRAWQLDPSQTRPGILAGYAAALDGRRAEADAIWNEINDSLAEDDPKRAMFDAITGAIGEHSATQE